MNISVSRLLEKIEEELVEAKHSRSEANVREHMYAIKAICELILQNDSNELVSVNGNKKVLTSITQPTGEGSQSFQQQRIKTDDGANGDSIFDF